MKYKIDIEEFLRKNNLTQTQLGDYLGIGQPQISGICHGKPIAQKHIENIPETIISFREALSPVLFLSKANSFGIIGHGLCGKS